MALNGIWFTQFPDPNNLTLVMWQIEGNSMIVSGYSNSSVCATNLRPIHTRDFAPGACSRGTLQEQSSSVCTNDFMGILHPREQNFHPAKCSTIFNQLNIWEQAPGANLASLKTLLVCTDTCKMSLEHAPGAKPLVCIGLYKQRPKWKMSFVYTW